MNDNFNALSAKYHQNLSAEQIAFVRKLGEIIDNFEQLQNTVVGVSVTFAPDFSKEYSWNGEILR